MRGRKNRKNSTTGCLCMFGKKKRAAQESDVEMSEQEAKKPWHHPNNLYDSPEERAFCEKFIVSGKPESYQSWHRFSQKLPNYLEERSFRKMLIEVRELFGLPKERSSALYSQYGDTYHHESDAVPASKHEAEIWHADNIIRLLEEVASHPSNYGVNVDALREFSRHFHALLHAIDELHLFHGYNARYDTEGSKEIAQNRLVSFIDTLDTEFQADMEIARRRNSQNG